MKINRDNLYHHLLEKQFTYIEKTALDAAFEKDWMEKWTISKEKHDDFKKYFISLNKKVLKINKTKALKNFEWFIKLHGINVKN